MKTEKNYIVFGIIWAGSIILGSGVGALINQVAAGGAIGVGLGLILTAVFCPGVYSTRTSWKK